MNPVTEKQHNLLIDALEKSSQKVNTAPIELSDDFILEHHMGYVSPDGEFYAPDYKTWKEDGFTPVYKEPITPRQLSDEEMKELINNFPIIFSPQDLLTFGRAIEERHGIK